MLHKIRRSLFWIPSELHCASLARAALASESVCSRTIRSFARSARDGRPSCPSSTSANTMLTVTPTPTATVPLCGTTPEICRMPVVGAKASILLRDKIPDDGDQIIWNRIKGAAGPVTPAGPGDGLAFFWHNARRVCMVRIVVPATWIARQR